MTENTEQINELSGIVEVRYGNEIYKTWTVKLISPFVIKSLKEKYPDSLAVRGLTDIVVFDNKSDDIIPVEIQKTPINIYTKTFMHSEFEKEIRKGLEDNIENYGKCWFFFDSEYLRFLQSGNVGKNTSIDMTWLVKLMKEKEFRVFVIKYDGVVKELTTKDFDFLKDVSQTCSIGYDNDERILIRNKLKIKGNVLHGYNFTQQEITQFENEFDNRDDNKHKDVARFYMQSINKRCELYGNIIHSIGNLPYINNILFCIVENKHKHIYNGIVLGLFQQNDFHGNSNHAQIQFVDKFNVAQYFSGYIKNKQLWDYCKSKERMFTMNEFRGIVEGTFNYQFLKKQSTMLDY